ncbi:MAG: helix-turn-helix transcriptional regulator [Candidatus Pedobacter colombiensis]|uniref:Helix-turn-helix transcriptional regulator n=1 Tax=Candidatus Pedobacter colombiensis TaxID=3121371 RepID=A0AAJ5WEW1_9SPHI|nr:helix-turn-helix transcriptional regulator [Pedobacter sp.]WEK21312.1 MAG: helix-turn-helix transcriptional regulator [Pedobacter sp.]
MEYALYQRIRIVREVLKIKQGVFAASLGISQSLLSKIEKEQRTIPIELIINICLIYNVGGDWILLEEGPMFKKGMKATSQEAKIVETPEIELLKVMPRTLLDLEDPEKLEKGLVAFADYIEKLRHKTKKVNKGKQ